MISSTVEDLREERQAADDAVRHFQFERFRSETLGSLSRAPEEVCDEMARECDLYILIIGERYGWVIPDLGISVTEREYNVARVTDRAKILVYVRAAGPKGRDLQETQFMERVTDFKAGYFRSGEFSSPDELKRKIQHDMAIWISDRLRQKQISYVDALSLPHPREVATSSIYVLAIILGVLIIPSALRYFGSSLQPSSAAIMRSFVDKPEIVLLPIGLLWMQVLLNSCVVVLLSVPILHLCVLTRRKKTIRILSALSHLCFGLATMFFLVGWMVFNFGTDISIFLVLGFTSFGWLLAAIKVELTTLSNAPLDDADAQSQVLALRKNLFLSRTIALGCPSLFGINFVYQSFVIGFDTRLGHAVQVSFSTFRLEYLYALLATSAITTFIAYSLIRLIQSSVGWTMIIGPALRRTLSRPK